MHDCQGNNDDDKCASAESHCKKLKWECKNECKPLTIAKVDSILALKEDFEGTVEEVRHNFDLCDGCPNGHYTKLVAVSLKSHREGTHIS